MQNVTFTTSKMMNGIIRISACIGRDYVDGSELAEGEKKDVLHVACGFF